MRVLVCGGRDFDDYEFLEKTLNELWDKYRFTVVINGQARGADKLADYWARQAMIAVDRYPAEWTKYGKAAGYIRNKRMLDEGKPELVVAFPGGSGTDMMIQLSKDAGVPIVQVGRTK